MERASPESSGVSSENELSASSTQEAETKMAVLRGRCVQRRWQSTGRYLLQQALVVELVQGWQSAAAEGEDASPLAVIPWRNKSVSFRQLCWISSVMSHGGQSSPAWAKARMPTAGARPGDTRGRLSDVHVP